MPTIILFVKGVFICQKKEITVGLNRLIAG